MSSRLLHIPETFFKELTDRPMIYKRVWLYWLGKHVEEIFSDGFIERQAKEFEKVEDIRDIYDFGIQLLQPDFKVMDMKFKRPRKVVEKNETAERIIAYLNEKAGTDFKPMGNNIQLISDLMKMGYVEDDFRTVIDRKIYDWKGTDREEYLRPLTLFHKNKFDNYLSSLNGKTTSKFKKQHDAAASAKLFFGIGGDKGGI